MAAEIQSLILGFDFAYVVKYLAGECFDSIPCSSTVTLHLIGDYIRLPLVESHPSDSVAFFSCQKKGIEWNKRTRYPASFQIRSLPHIFRPLFSGTHKKAPVSKS